MSLKPFVLCLLLFKWHSYLISVSSVLKDLWNTKIRKCGISKWRGIFEKKILKIYLEETWRIRQFKLIVIPRRSELLTRLTFRPPFNYELSKIGVSTIYLKRNVISNFKSLSLKLLRKPWLRTRPFVSDRHC